MIVGIGTDIIENTRFDKWMRKPSLIARFFSEEEIQECQKRKEGMRDSLAVRFAAKEAFVKAAGTGFAFFCLKEIQILSEPSGKPRVKLTGRAESFYRSLKDAKVHVSLSHETHYSVSIVLIEQP